MRVNLLAKRYAQAVFDLALETKTEDRIAKDMRLVNTVFAENRELRKLVDNPVLDGSKKVKVIRALFGSHVHELSLRFLNLITRKGREQYIQGICQAFEDIFLQYKNIMRAEITTSSPVDTEIRKSVLAKLQAMSHKDIQLKEVIDQDIIGGFVLRMEDYQYDASVVNQLRKLRKSFSENLYIKQF